MNILLLILIILSCIFDISIIFTSVLKIFKIEIFNFYENILFNYSTFFIIISIFLIIIFILAYIKEFMKLGISGGPFHTRNVLKQLLKYGVKTIFSIISFIILLIILKKTNILISIIILLIGITFLFFIIKLIYKLLEKIIRKKHHLK